MRVCCAADGRAHACAEARRTPTGAEMRGGPSSGPAPFPSGHTSSCETEPTPAAGTPGLAWCGAGEVSESCSAFLRRSLSGASGQRTPRHRVVPRVPVCLPPPGRVDARTRTLCSPPALGRRRRKARPSMAAASAHAPSRPRSRAAFAGGSLSFPRWGSRFQGRRLGSSCFGVCKATALGVRGSRATPAPGVSEEPRREGCGQGRRGVPGSGLSSESNSALSLASAGCETRSSKVSPAHPAARKGGLHEDPPTALERSICCSQAGLGKPLAPMLKKKKSKKTTKRESEFSSTGPGPSEAPEHPSRIQTPHQCSQQRPPPRRGGRAHPSVCLAAEPGLPSPSRCLCSGVVSQASSCHLGFLPSASGPRR